MVGANCYALSKASPNLVEIEDEHMALHPKVGISSTYPMHCIIGNTTSMSIANFGTHLKSSINHRTPMCINK